MYSIFSYFHFSAGTLNGNIWASWFGATNHGMETRSRSFVNLTRWSVASDSPFEIISIARPEMVHKMLKSGVRLLDGHLIRTPRGAVWRRWPSWRRNPLYELTGQLSFGTCVYDNSIRIRFNVNPCFIRWSLNLETANFILAQNCNQSRIIMFWTVQ